jgi:hypothetical protein
LSGIPPNKGNLRVTFFYSQLQCNHTIAAYEKGDFLIDNQFTFEIGGKQTTYEQGAGLQNSFVVRDKRCLVVCIETKPELSSV